MKGRGLRSKIISGFFFFEILLIIYIALTISFGFYHYIMKDCEKYVYGYLKSASKYIDGDQIQKYAENGTPDEYYDEVLRYLDSLRSETQISTFCIFVPYEDDLVYLWMSAEGEDSYEWLGKHEGYMENGKETRDATFRKNPVESISTYKYEGKKIIAGFYPIYNSEGEPVALIDIDLSFPNVLRNIILSVLTILVGVLLISIVIGRILYIYFNGILIRPINTLNRESRRMIETLDNEDEVMVGVHTGDELEQLSDSFAQMNVDVRRYIKENLAIAAEKERIGADLELASKIQRGMLPKNNETLKHIKGFDLYASMTPAKEVGGDFYDFFMVDDTHVAILIADVSDKGAAAALFMATSKTLINSRAGMGGTASEIISYVDKMITEKNSMGMFVTVWFAIIDITTGHVDACNAGHDYPAIMKQTDGSDNDNNENSNENDNTKGYVIEKTVHGPPIGFIPGAEFESYEMNLRPGDKIFLYTDGVNESKRADGERFGLDRILEVLNSNKDASNEEIVEKVKTSVKEFAGDEPQFDDMTMLSFSYEGIE